MRTFLLQRTCSYFLSRGQVKSPLVTEEEREVFPLPLLQLIPKIVAEEAFEIIFKLCTHFLDPPPHDMQTIHFIVTLVLYLFSVYNTLPR